MIKDTLIPTCPVWVFRCCRCVAILFFNLKKKKRLAIFENWNHVSGHVTSHSLHDTAKDLSLHLEKWSKHGKWTTEETGGYFICTCVPNWFLHLSHLQKEKVALLPLTPLPSNVYWCHSNTKLALPRAALPGLWIKVQLAEMPKQWWEGQAEN